MRFRLSSPRRLAAWLQLILFLTHPSMMMGATYYVDLDGGVDSNAGTKVAPWKTLPGTRNVGDTAYVSAAYGPGGLTVSTSARVAAGDTFMLKLGTIHDSTDGGKVMFNSTYYVTTANTTNNPITIMTDPTWGSGAIPEFNGTGMTLGGGGFGLLHITVGGIFVSNVLVAKSPYNGISAYPLVDIQGPTIRKVFFGTNGTTYTPGLDDASEGNIHLLRSYGGTIADCTVMGGNSSYQGMSFGESHRACWGYVVTNCYVENMNGNDDGGIAYKALNSQIDFINCTATGCYKGFDGGEINGDGSNILYRINGFQAYSNIFGLNINGAGGAYAGTIDFYVWNSSIYTNGHNGIYVYSGPYNVTLAHNLVSNNGKLAGFSDSNVRIENDGGERQIINANVFNNIFDRPAGPQNFYNHYFRQDVDADGLNLTMDYNGWIQRASEQFAAWAQSNPLPDNTLYIYGADGPGHASGNWWAWYSSSTTPPANGRTGHFHADPHSKGTGATDTTPPPFTSPVNYRLTNHYAGTNISVRSWYLTEMGIDAGGQTRVFWDMGPLEYSPPVESTATITNGRRLKRK